MKITKKLLSLLLVVLMITSSMSVSFGTFSFTASAATWEEYDQNPINFLAKNLESATIKKYTDKYNIGGGTGGGSETTGDTRYYTTVLAMENYDDYLFVKDVIIYIYKAMLATDNYRNYYNVTSDDTSKKCVTLTDLKDEIINGITASNGSISSSAKEFISYILEDSHTVKHSDSNTSKVNGTVTNTIKITVDDPKGYLASITEGDYNTVGSMETQFSFYVKVTGKNAGQNLGYTVSCTTTGYHHYLWDAYWSLKADANAPKVDTTNATVKSTLATYANEVDSFIERNNFDAMALMSLEEIESVKSNIDNKTAAIKTYIADANEGKQDEKYDQFFPGYADKIKAWKTTAEDAKSIAQYSETADAVAAYQNDNKGYGTFNWGGFDEATIRADYADFTTTFATILNNATVYNYFVQHSVFSDSYIKNFRDNVVAFDLEDTKEAADALWAKYENGGAVTPDIDGEEEQPIQPEVDAALLTGYINSYNSYTSQVKNAIFPEGIDYLLKLQEEFECTISDCIVYFAEHANLDYTDVKTDAVIAEIETAKKQLEALNALKASVNYAENLDLLAPIFELADEFIEYLYSLLAERFALQVANADAAYTEIGRPTSNLTLEQFSKVNGAMSAVEDKILDFIDAEGKGSKISTATRNLFAAIETNFAPAYDSFKQNRAFDLFTPSEILIVREDNSLEYFRKNVDVDNDGKGEYTVSDEDVLAIINLLEGALKDPTVAKLLGDLINKDKVTGEPTGEPFDLENLINGLLEKIYTDDLLNTIISFLYPIIAKAFADVWAGLPEDFTTTAPTDMGDALVKAKLVLDDVDTAIYNVGIALSPSKLADKLMTNATYKTKYSDVIDGLYEVGTKTGYDADGNYIDPWKDARLYTDKIGEDGKVVIDESTGKAKQVYDLEWGITDRASFIDAAAAALSGLEPLLYALLLNQPFVNKNTTGDSRVRGCKIGVSASGATATVNVSIVGDVVCDLKLDPITLMFQVSENDGYSNVLAPIFETLGLKNIPKSTDMKNTKDFLEKGLFAMVDQLIAKVAANPIETILGIIPNLVYALEADLVAPLLDLLAIEIYYEADAAYSADIPSSVDWITGILGVDDPVLGAVNGAMKAEKEVNGVKVPDPIKINVGQMIDLKSMGVNLSGGLKGILDLVGIELPNLDTAFLAKAGELKWNTSVRTKYTYTYQPAGYSEKRAAYIDAHEEDVLIYIVKWALTNLDELLATFGVDTSSMGEFVTTLFDTLSENSHDAVAALVELLNQKEYASKKFEWFDGYVGEESVVGNTALEIYLNPENDWTPEKAQYLYDNLEAILVAVFTMAKLDLDKETEGLQISLEDFIGDAINGLLTDKTLTSLAALLAKLDLNALLAGDKTEEGEAATPEVVAEGEAAEKEPIDVNALVKSFLGLDLAAIAAQYAPIAEKLEEAKEAGEEYVYNFGVDSGDKTFAAALAEMLAPLSVVLDFILADGNLEINLGTEKVVLHGADGYDNAIVPLLEALNCTVVENPENALLATINALVGKIEALTTNTEENTKDGVIYGIIDMLPGLFYYLSSNGLSTSILNLLQPVLVVLDTIRPIYELDINGLINGLLVETGIEIDITKLDTNAVINILSGLVGLDLSGLKHLIYDICLELSTSYDSASSYIKGNAKTAKYKEGFMQADLLTVVLSFLLDWATVAENGAALDEMLGTNGLIASIGKVFEDVDITYGTPNWGYVFATEEEFNDYLASGELVDTTLNALNYPNDWSPELAQYFADNLSKLVDIVIGMINKDNAEAPQTLAAMLQDIVDGNLGDIFTADTINNIVGMLQGIIANVDDTLLDLGYLLDLDIVGLKNYTCTAEINNLDTFVAELASILDTYAKPLIDLLFFGDDIRIAAKANADGEKVDTIVINGGLGYEKGLGLILEALGCDVPEVKDATAKTVLESLVNRINAILADPVDEIIALLPNLVYFLNADGLSVAVNNLLAPVFVLVDKINALGLLEEPISIEDLLKFKTVDEEGNEKEVVIDLDLLSLDNILALVEELTGLDLGEAKSILVNLCYGKLEKATLGYKMVADNAKDTITIILTTAFALLSDDDFAAKLAEMTGVEVLAALNNVFAYSNIEYVAPDWLYCADENGDATGDSIPVIESAITYPNDWNEDTAKFIAEKLPELVDAVVAMINTDENAPKTLSALLEDVLSDTNIYATDVLQGLINMLAELLKDIDDELLKLGVIVDVDIVGLKNHKVGKIEATETQTVAEVFAAEVAKILGYANGIVEWLLLGNDYKFFVTDEAKNNGVYDIIALNGANGYAEGLALILEALGCANLPVVEGNTTEEIVAGVLDSLAKRIDEIIANPVEEILSLLPNLIYFINANGLAVAIQNLAAAPIALLAKLSAFGIEGDINKLINIEKLLGVEKDLAIGVDNLTLAAILELVGELTGLDLSVLNGSLANFALGELQPYTSVSGKTAYKMAYTDEFGRHDMITVVLTSVISAVFVTEGNAEVLEEMLDTKLITAVEDIFNPAEPEYKEVPKYDYTGVDGIIGDVINTNLTEYPTDWTEAKADWLVANLPVLVDAIVSLIEINGVKYESLSALLTANVNIFTAETLQKLVDMIAGLIENIDDRLLAAAGIVLDVDVVGLKNHVVPADIATVGDFAGELANILTTYANGLVEWILLGKDYRFFVKDVDENGLPVDFITIRGTQAYAEGIALVLEALGCELPEVYGSAASTETIVADALAAIATRVETIFANPVEEVINMLPGIIYFLNANGLAVVVDNLTAGIGGILNKLDAFGVNIDINELVNLQDILDTTVEISLDNLTLATVIDVVAEKTTLDLTAVKEVFVNYALGEVVEYTSVSSKPAYTMIYTDDQDKADMLTAVFVAVLLTAFDTEGNAEKLEEMIGSDIISAIETVINDAPVAYGNPDWFYCAPNGEATGETTPVIESALTYPNDWNKEAAQYLTDNLGDLVDTVVALVKSDENATLAALLQGVLTEANIFSTETLESLLGLIQNIDLSAYEALLGAGMILDIDIKGLLKHKVPAGIDTIGEFAAELANILNTYAKGLVEWLLLGNDFTFFYKNYDANKNPEAYITVNGAHGYANGLALILEALGCENLPAVDFAEGAVNDTTAIVEGVLASVANRIDAILANPVDEIVALLPNLIYFINTNGVSVAVNNMIAAVSTLLIKLKVFDVTNKDGEALTLADLVDLKTLLGLEDTDAAISVNNLTLKSILEAVGLMVGLDLSVLETVLGEFALGKIETYESVSNLEVAPRKMVYADKFDKHHMVTVLLTSVLLTVFETEGNGEAIAEMLGTDLLTKIEDVFNNIAPSYKAPNWKYVLGDNTSLDSVIHQIQNPNNWTNEDSAYLAAELPEAVDMIVRQLSDAETLSELLGGVLADANIFTTETLNNVIGLLAGLLEDIDEGLVEVAGLVIDVDVNGLKKHTVPAGIDTIGEFAAELANILTTYAKGLVEWLLLGRDFKFFVKDVDAYGTPVDFITISGGQGYAEGLALILEAIGCKNLPAAEGKTEEIVAGVLASLAARIDEIIANPVNEIIDLLPNLLYFINTNGLAVAVNNTIAAITALLERLAYLGVELDLNELVDLKKLLGLPETALISLNKLDMEAILEIVEFKVPELSLTHVKNILVNFALGKLEAYDSVSASEAYKMVYRDFGVVVDPELGLTQRDIDRGNMLTVVANTVVMVLEDEANFNFFFNLLGEKAMTVILSLFNFDEVPVQSFNWWNKEAADTGKIFSAFETSEMYKGDIVYGEIYTQEMSQYIADNFEEFVNNIIYLLGLDVNGDGKYEVTLTELINGLINGGLYNSSNIIAIRDLLAGLADSINNITVSGIKVGPYIKMVLKLSKIADLDAIAKVAIPEFTENRAMFVEYLCKILEPIAPVLKFVLADEDFRFFTTYDEVTMQPTDAITIKGAEGYAYGIIPLLELLECKDILAPEAYYAAVEADNGVLLTSILNPLLDRVDEIVANPAEEILEMLPNIIYFVNSNGVDTVVKNTLNAVYAVLDAISPIAKIDLYEIFGVDLATIDFNWIVDKVVEILGNQGYSFTVSDIMAINELTVGTIVSYKSVNGETAYKMVYSPNGGIAGGKAEMITIIERLVITFIADKKNQDAVVKFFTDKLGMGETGKEFLAGTIEVIAGALSQTHLGMQAALAAVYYLFYGLDIGAGETVDGLKDINKIWEESIKNFKDKVPGMGSILDKVFDIDGMDDIITEEGLAPNGFIAFFQRIANFFQRIADWFRNLFSFGKK